MPNFILDTFTDTAGTPLDSHTPDLGGPVTKITGQTGVAQITAANRLRAGTAGALTGYQYTAVPSAADYDVICDAYIASITADASASGPMARIQSGAQTYYWGRLSNDPANGAGPFSGYDIYKCVAGTLTQIASSTNTPLTAGSTTRLKLSVRGTAITLYASNNGGATFTAVCSATDSSIPTAGLAGVGFYANSTPTDTNAIQADNLSGASTVLIAPNNTAWFSSPGNWVISSSAAISTDFGAKRSIVITGTTTANLTFDLSALTTAAVASGDYPQIRYSIDGGVTTDVAVSSSVALLSGAATTSHEIVYEFVRGNYNIDAYTTPVMAIRETGLILGIAGTAASPADLQPDRMFVAGDSITAGLSLLSAANPGGGDATATYAKALGIALGAEVGIGGKGGVGWAFAGGANVPAFTTEWKNAWNGQARSFPTLKRLVAVMGTNDGLNGVTDSAVTTAVTSWLSDARATVGTATWIHIVIPFGGFKRSAITAAVASYLTSHAGDKTDLIDLGTLIQAGLSGPYGTATRPAPFDGIHPNAIAHGQLGAALAVAIRSAENVANSSRSTNNVGGGILAGL
jgi:lysophospholipase L1-like esterase